MGRETGGLADSSQAKWQRLHCTNMPSASDNHDAHKFSLEMLLVGGGANHYSGQSLVATHKLIYILSITWDSLHMQTLNMKIFRPNFHIIKMIVTLLPYCIQCGLRMNAIETCGTGSQF